METFASVFNIFNAEKMSHLAAEINAMFYYGPFFMTTVSPLNLQNWFYSRL